MRILGIALTLAMASVLMAAALEKARTGTFASTLQELGLRRGTRSIAVLLIAMEVLIALAIIFQPGSILTLAGVLILATSFALAGAIAIGRRRTIRCGCFGYGSSTLGKTQIFAWPLWIGGAMLLPSAQDFGFFEWRPALFAAVALTLAIPRMVIAVRETLRARGDRRSAWEMHVWLR